MDKSTRWKPSRQGSSPTLAEIQSALHAINPDCPRHEWAQIGMAVKSELGESGFPPFDGWSQGGKSYNQADCRDTWKSIKPDGGTTIRTLFGMATAAGWKWTPPRTGQYGNPSRRATLAHDPETAWAACLQDLQDHTYLREKAVQAFGLRLYRGPLVIAGMACDGALAMLLVDGTGKAITIQFISPTREKRFLPGCPKKGAFHVIGILTEIIVICEGYATGATIHMATGYMVIVAVDSGNLMPVSQTIRAMYPHHTIILAADDDRHQPANTGLTKATHAAAAIVGYLATPEFGPDRLEGATDFNDLAAHLGMDAVKMQLAGAKRVEPEAATQTPPQNKKPMTYSLRELMQRQFEDVAFLVFGLLSQGVYILGGKPKVGKSWLALHLLLCVAYGLRVFGTLPSTKGMALYISLEDHDRRLWKRIKQVFRQEPTDDLHFTTQWPRIGQGCVEQLDEWLTDHAGTKLVIIDTLARIKPPRAKNGDIYAEDYAAVSAFKDLSERHGITVILVHHLRKASSDDPADMLSGTTGLAGGVDGTLILTRKTGSKALTMHRSGRDLIDDEPLVLDWDRESGTWTALTAATTATMAVTEGQQPIIDAMRAFGHSMTCQEIAKAVDKPDDPTRKTLDRMVERGFLLTAGRYPKRYSIAADDAHTPTREERMSVPGGESNGYKTTSTPSVSSISGTSGTSSTFQKGGESGHSDIKWTNVDAACQNENGNETICMDGNVDVRTMFPQFMQNDSEPDYEEF
ncbi:MAG: AAA family ATPase [Magnetococcus sp. XQGC-1]